MYHMVIVIRRSSILETSSAASLLLVVPTHLRCPPSEVPLQAVGPEVALNTATVSLAYRNRT